MWAIDILHCLHKKMWNEIYHLHAVSFCVLVTISCSWICFYIVYMYNNLHHYKSARVNCNCPQNYTQYYTSHNSIPENMWYVMNMMKIKIIILIIIIISTIIIIIIIISKPAMNNCVKSIDMENIYPIYVDRYDDFTKITWVTISKITSAWLLHLSLTMISSLSFSCKPACCLWIACSFLYNIQKEQYDIYQKVTYFQI